MKNSDEDAYIEELRKTWPEFIERLADAEHPRDPTVPVWGPEDEAWYQTRQHLDHVAAAYISWQAEGIAINDWGPIDDKRLVELVEPYLKSESDRQLFLRVCQQLTRERKRLNG
jgi:hypothetical protein